MPVKERPHATRATNASTKPSQAKPTAKKKPKRLTAGEKRGAQTLAAILVVAGILYLLSVLIIALVIWYSFSTPAESETLYSLQIVTASDEAKKASYSVGEANNSYGFYLRYSDLAPLCGFGVAGDEEQITLYLPAEDAVGNETLDYVTFYRNSSLIYVNGNSVRLSSPVLFEGDDYLLPVSLFESYLSGLEITYDSDDLLCTVTVPDSPAFSLKLHKPTEAQQCDLTLIDTAD